MGIIALIVSKILSLIRQLKHPLRDIIAYTKPLQLENHVQALVGKIGFEEGLKSVSTLLSDQVNDVISIGDLSRNAIIVFSKRIVDTLSQEQILAVILHELYHVTSQLRDDFFLELANKLGWIRFFIFGLLVTWGFSYLPSFRPESFTTSAEFFPRLSIAFVFIMLGIMVLILLLSAVLLSDIVSNQGTPPAPRYYYMDEYLADSFSVLKTNNPNSLRTALAISDAAKSGLFIDKGSLVLKKLDTKREESMKNITLKEIFALNPRRQVPEQIYALLKFIVLGKFGFEKSCPMRRRFLLIDKLERLLNGQIIINVKKESYPSAITSSKIHPQMQLLSKRQPDPFPDFISYAKSHDSKFNIKNCSEAIGLDLFYTFLLLLVTVQLDMIEIITPI